MAKLSALQTYNEVARNCGESTVTDLNTLSGLQNVIWNKIIEAIQDICTDEEAQLSFLEDSGEIPMTTGNYQYLISDLTSGADLLKEDEKSFRQSDAGQKITYLTAQEWDAKYPDGIGSDRVGCPTEYTRYGGYFVFNKQAGTTENGKNISFRYWKLPSYYDTSTPAGTVDIPEPFDRTCMVALATLKVLTYLGNEEASVYKMQVFGDGDKVEGSLDKLRRIYCSPKLKPRMSYVF